ncbi:hypothetical protein [Atopomonas sediminilitoris]|uniref:hypothetical protein n=1 Tax=Atopomonas sediminilitoris TaxID=2919919 RepID=UPI001F4F062E|nr:hypothetical protein [Atopomonas sediminilitoris]MCJ8170888.1 hypothetical protein [Atopomonas sediminilitoris]
MKKTALALAVALASASAIAVEQGEHRFNAFGTVGISYLGGEDDGRSFGIEGQTTDSWRGDQLSKFGAQLQYGLTDTLGVTVQVTAKADQDTWKGNLEWLYLSYQATDELMLRAGRLRTPVYMYSETLDVGYTYPWLRLPDEVYGQVQLTNYEGFDLVYNRETALGSLSFQTAVGQAKEREVFQFDDQYDIDYNDFFAANIALSTEYGRVRIGYAEADLKGGFDLRPFDHTKGKFSSIGYQYDQGTLVANAEATKRVIEGSNFPTLDAFYVMAGYHIGDFLPHLTYSQLDEEGSGRQSSWIAGLNYQVTPTIIVKSEYKRVDTSGGYAGQFVENRSEATTRAVQNFFGVPTQNYDGDIVSIGLEFVY